MTIDTFYRFRKIDNLFGKYDELENQSIYFAPPEQLNDPIEGFRDIYWQGDAIIWENLFNHYLLCLTQFSLDYLMIGEKIKIESKIKTLLTVDDLHENFQKEFAIISDKFIKSECLQNVIKNIVKYREKVSGSELSYYLKGTHFFAVHCIFEHLLKTKCIPVNLFENLDLEDINTMDEEFFETLNALIKDQGEEGVKKWFGLMEHSSIQMDLVLNHKKDTKSPNKSILINFFPYKYTQNLEKCMYPEWFTACFMSKSTNSSVWGNYGENHTGVCLVFSPELREDGINYFSLDKSITGWNDKGAIKGKTPFRFYPIRYMHKQDPINFFESIAQLPRGKVYKTWFVDKNENKSVLMPTYDDEWRNAYWNKFYIPITQKTIDWEYENEHRLIINNMMGSYTNKDTTLKYDFKSLRGIIFGIKTSEENKHRIMEIIERKVRENEHYCFKFYQAYYCRETGEIQHHELRMLKFKKPEVS